MTIFEHIDSVFWFAVYLAAGVATLAGFTWAYIRTTPYDEAKEITAGHLAPAIALAGAMLGFTFPLLVASYTHSTLVGYLAWSVISCATQLGVFWAMHRLLPRVIENNNSAGAICYAAASISIGLINAASFIP